MLIPNPVQFDHLSCANFYSGSRSSSMRWYGRLLDVPSPGVGSAYVMPSAGSTGLAACRLSNVADSKLCLSVKVDVVKSVRGRGARSRHRIVSTNQHPTRARARKEPQQESEARVETIVTCFRRHRPQCIFSRVRQNPQPQPTTQPNKGGETRDWPAGSFFSPLRIERVRLDSRSLPSLN